MNHARRQWLCGVPITPGHGSSFAFVDFASDPQHILADAEVPE
jgi:hypothetical protein